MRSAIVFIVFASHDTVLNEGAVKHLQVSYINLLWGKSEQKQVSTKTRGGLLYWNM